MKQFQKDRLRLNSFNCNISYVERFLARRKYKFHVLKRKMLLISLSNQNQISFLARSNDNSHSFFFSLGFTLLLDDLLGP